MKILESGTVKIDADSLVFSHFNFSGPLQVPSGAFAYDAATLAGLDWIEQRVAEERARVMARIEEGKQRRMNCMWHEVTCCKPSAEDLKLIADGDYCAEELWGGPRPTCPECIDK